MLLRCAHACAPQFRLWRDVAAVVPCRVGSAPSAALALHLRDTPPDDEAAAATSDAEAPPRAAPQPCAVLEQWSAFGEDDNRACRNAVRTAHAR